MTARPETDPREDFTAGTRTPSNPCADAGAALSARVQDNLALLYRGLGRGHSAAQAEPPRAWAKRERVGCC